MLLKNYRIDCIAYEIQKSNLLLFTFQTRSKQSLWPQIEATFKQIDTAATELECFEVLQKQELSAASHRISGIWEEVQKQKELERTLQLRYGNLLVDLEKMQKIMDDRKAQAQKEEEIAAENRALQLAEADANQTVGENADSSEAVSVLAAVDCENSMLVTSTPNELTGEQPNSSMGHEHETSNAMDIDTEKESVGVSSDVGLSDDKLPSAVGEDASLLPDDRFEDSDKSQTIDIPSEELLVAPANGTPDVTVVVECKISNDSSAIEDAEGSTNDFADEAAVVNAEGSTNDSADGAAIQNAGGSTDIAEEVKDVETQQQPVIEAGNSDINSTNLDFTAPASSSNKDGPSNNDNVELPHVEGEATESNV